jgi:hypothetical protein
MFRIKFVCNWTTAFVVAVKNARRAIAIVNLPHNVGAIRMGRNRLLNKSVVK